METERVLMLRGRKISLTAWCEMCAGRVEMVTAEEAARLSATSARELFRRVEREQLHFTETDEGGLLICRNSL